VHIFAGSIEVQMLLLSVILGLAHLVVATAMVNKDRGLAWGIGMRDAGAAPPVSTLTGRLLRAFGNFKETFVFFAVAVLAVTVLARQNAGSALGAQIYFWARLVYIPVYAAGIAGLRTLVWTVSIVGLLMVLAAALA